MSKKINQQVTHRLPLLNPAPRGRFPDGLELPPESVGVGVGVHEAGDLGLGAAGGPVHQALAAAALRGDWKRRIGDFLGLEVI